MYTVSLSYKNTPVEIRECFSFNTEERKEFLIKAPSAQGVDGCVLLSTCNRTEIYFSGDEHGAERLERLAAEIKNTDAGRLMRYLRVYSGENAVRHLHNVACGMDSMILGEDEILGQVKDAYAAAHDEGAVNRELNEYFKSAVTCAKRIKTDTEVSKTSTSAATLAARSVFDFAGDGAKVLVIGASGKIGSAAAKNIISHGGAEVIGTARSSRFSHTGMTMTDYTDRYGHMDWADVIISATSSPHYTVTAQQLMPVLVHKKPRLFIDLSVPKDIDPSIAELEGCSLINIDDFKKISAQNNKKKLKEAERALAYIDEAVEDAVKLAEFSKITPELETLRSISGAQLLFRMRDAADAAEMRAIAGVIDRIRTERKDELHDA